MPVAGVTLSAVSKQVIGLDVSMFLLEVTKNVVSTGLTISPVVALTRVTAVPLISTSNVSAVELFLTPVFAPASRSSGSSTSWSTPSPASMPPVVIWISLPESSM